MSKQKPTGPTTLAPTSLTLRAKARLGCSVFESDRGLDGMIALRTDAGECPLDRLIDQQFAQLDYLREGSARGGVRRDAPLKERVAFGTDDATDPVLVGRYCRLATSETLAVEFLGPDR